MKVDLLTTSLKKVVPFPTHLNPRRQVILHSGLKQSCDLAEYNDNIRLQIPGTDIFPQPYGRYAKIAFTDCGWTHEDGCLISASFAKTLTTISVRTQTFAHHDQEEIAPLVKEGQVVYPGAIVCMIEDEELPSNVPTMGLISSVETYDDIWEGSEVSCVCITSEHKHICKPGTKIAGLHGNKFTISKIMRDKDMFQTPDGEIIDIIMSPFSNTKRCSPSVFMEALLVECMDRMKIDTLPITSEPDIDNIKAMMDIAGLGDGQRHLYFRGKPCPNKTLAGKGFIMVLNHHPEDKLRIGDEVKYDHRGLSRTGIGEGRPGRDEMEVLDTMNCQRLIQEILRTKQESNLPALTREAFKVFGIYP